MELVSALALAVLIAFGYVTGTQGLTIKPFIHTAARVQQQVSVVTYRCPPHISAAIAAGSHLDPNEFCQRQ